MRNVPNKLTKNPILLALSVVMLLAGAGLLSFGAIALLNDDSSSKRPTPTVVISQNSPTPRATAPAVPTAINNSPVTRIIIERLKVDAPTMVLGLDANNIPEVPNDQNTNNAAQVVAWYNFSSLPGQGSNAVFAGHVTWNGRAIFHDLDKLQAGDTVRVFTEDGKQLVYEVTENLLVEPERTDLLYGTKEDIVTLVTCGGTWIPNRNDPFGGEYANRVVVRAKFKGLG